VLAWIELFLKRYCANRTDTLVSLSWLVLFAVLVVPLLRWALWDAVWYGDPVVHCHSRGACWVYVRENFENFLYGTYPRAAVWRIHLVFFVVCCYALWAYIRPSSVWLWSAWVVMPLSWYGILYGGFFGLDKVATSYWGGFSLNIILSMVIVVLSFPVGLLLALARQSELVVVHYIARIVIDAMRGLPLVTVLFFAALVSVYFFPVDGVPDKFVRVSCAGVLFGGAYMAEAIRGGIQAVSISQYEAAYALGLRGYQIMGYVVLPQAMRVAFPSLLSIAIALFKDTTLVSTIAMMDVLAIMQSTTAHTTWMRYFVEGYLFVAALFWVVCVGISYVGSLWERRYKMVL